MNVDLYHSHHEVPIRGGQLDANGLRTRFGGVGTTGALIGRVGYPLTAQERATAPSLVGSPKGCPTVAMGCKVTFRQTSPGFSARGGAR